MSEHILEAERRVEALQAAQLAWAETSLEARRALESARTRAVVAVATRYGASVTQLHSLRRGMYDGGWTVELERSGGLVDKLLEWGHLYHGGGEDNEEWEFEIIAELVCEMWSEVVLETEAWVSRTRPVLDYGLRSTENVQAPVATAATVPAPVAVPVPVPVPPPTPRF